MLERIASDPATMAVVAASTASVGTTGRRARPRPLARARLEPTVGTGRMPSVAVTERSVIGDCLRRSGWGGPSAAQRRQRTATRRRARWRDRRRARASRRERRGPGRRGGPGQVEADETPARQAAAAKCTVDQTWSNGEELGARRSAVVRPIAASTWALLATRREVTGGRLGDRQQPGEGDDGSGDEETVAL